jgi:HJR/Mrr/RecB family endonuclease
LATRKRQSGGSLGGLVIGLLVLWFFLDSLNNRNSLLTLLVLVGIAVAAVWLVRRLSGPKTATAQELAQRFAAVGLMSGSQFEHFVANLLQAMGHRATVLGGSGDQGVDVMVDYFGERVAVQCKNYKRAVGNKPVQEVYAGARYHRCAQAWVVAPAGYTKGAHDLASSTGVLLFDANGIRQWIKKVDELERKRQQVNVAPPQVVKGGPDDSGGTRGVQERAVWHPHPDDPPKG